jgi:hypothetical protein
MADGFAVQAMPGEEYLVDTVRVALPPLPAALVGR